jgi:glutamate dehydrogenase (NAD(P)+)
MAVIHDETGRAVGLPRVLGGIPLDEIGATGFGIAQCAEVAAEFCDLKLHGATVAVEGFGSVGRHAARFLVEKGARLIAASDTGGTIYQPDGIDVRALTQVKQQAGTVTAYRPGETLSLEALLTLPCDILIPAARPDCIRADNAHGIKARVILQGANIPVTPDAERILFDAGVMNVPDFIANAGGVICAAVEFHGGSESTAFEQIANKIRHNTHEVLSVSRDERIMPREAAVKLATARNQQAMSFRTSG